MYSTQKLEKMTKNYFDNAGKYDNGGKLLSEYDQTGSCVKDYLYLGGKMIGEYQPAASTYYYYASDQINSTRLVTDSTGAVVRSAQYDPYGGLYKTWVDNYHPKPGFSGKEREPSSDMDYFGARYYGHRQYRFNSVDPGNNKDKALANPQMWNLYSYCYNSPISLLDPDGRAPASPMDSWYLNADHYRRALGESTYNKVTVENAIIGAAGLVALSAGVAWELFAPTVAAADKVAEKYGNYVYQSVNSMGEVQYVGITNNLARRAAEHLSSKGIQIEKVLSGLSRSAARAVEQALIEIYGLGQSGGTLLNKINSISLTNPKYAEQLQKGFELLQKGGYQ